MRILLPHEVAKIRSFLVHLTSDVTDWSAWTPCSQSSLSFTYRQQSWALRETKAPEWCTVIPWRHVTYYLPSYAVKSRDTAQSAKWLAGAELPVVQFPTGAETHCHPIHRGSEVHTASYANDNAVHFPQEESKASGGWSWPSGCIAEIQNPSICSTMLPVHLHGAIRGHRLHFTLVRNP
jgi:hypothetical protein